jgi:hypothetical protein
MIGKSSWDNCSTLKPVLQLGQRLIPNRFCLRVEEFAGPAADDFWTDIVEWIRVMNRCPSFLSLDRTLATRETPATTIGTTRKHHHEKAAAQDPGHNSFLCGLDGQPCPQITANDIGWTAAVNS